MRCANYRKSLANLVILRADQLRSGHINQFHIAFGVDHKVLWFDVAADNLVVIEVL